ncbi:MAG: 2-amino-4-hydroxy-6-hydroxymethyldihydropteridine diphosphokinase [Proteobacteria bacterium]|nr:2-amino-4-hydroxy-6-hydroxymethyldihydropteridine diphosphokinase [Pseudomonadota bacterium]
MGQEKTAYIGLGSNVGDRIANIAEAARKIADLPGTRAIALSSLFETAPLSVRGGPFINAVMAIVTGMGPHRLLADLLETETAMGRKRQGPGPQPRNIDLDLLLYGELVIREKGLIIPHPGIFRRRFVLDPLSEIDPDLRVPLTGGGFSEPVSLLRDHLGDQQVVKIGSLEALA